jgi:uncharacterized membrane-anchored protein
MHFNQYNSLHMATRNPKLLLSKVPQITGIFWLTKILTTGMGETTSDFLAHNMRPIIAVALGAAGLLIALLLQLAVRRYVPWVYWLCVVMVSVFGTMAADVAHVGLGVPYVVSSAFFAAALTVVFVVWYKTERSLSIHSIHNARREVFYWAAVLTTFALGTATGDMTATTMHLGYLASGILFAGIFAIPVVGYYVLGPNSIAAFWFAYILTRPLGASFADWMGVSHDRGGLGLGTGPVSVALLALIAVLVGYLSLTRQDVEEKRP